MSVSLKTYEVIWKRAVKDADDNMKWTDVSKKNGLLIPHLFSRVQETRFMKLRMELISRL